MCRYLSPVNSCYIATIRSEFGFLKLLLIVTVFCVNTQYELKELKRRQEEEERIRAEELAAHEAAIAALHSPAEGTHPDQYVPLI